jgi:hypothetical protein
MISALARPPIARSLAFIAAAALAAVCVVHLLDGPGSLSDHAYIGALELGLAAACAPLAVWLLVRPTGAVWKAALALNLAAVAAFIISRTVGLPGSTDDVGNWGQLLGVINLAVEAIVISAALTAMRLEFRTERPPSRARTVGAPSRATTGWGLSG